MPKLNPAHQVVHERLAARRIQQERTARGWTVEHLSERLAQVGYALDRTAVYKIESGARRISVDELVAFAKAFGRKEATVGRLVMPLNDEVRRMLREHADLEKRYDEAHRQMRALEARLLDIADENGDELIVELLRQQGSEIGDVLLTTWRILGGRTPQQIVDEIERDRG